MIAPSPALALRPPAFEYVSRLFVLLAVPLFLNACDPSGPPATDESVAVASAMGGGDTTGYARAVEPRPFTFPDDHGPHPDFKTEWWYVTGNLDTPTGRHFGYQFTIFRVALAPPDSGAPPGRHISTSGRPATDTTGSEWRADQFYMAHLAVSDVENETHYDFERFSRGAAGLAGARSEPFRVWLEDWVMTEQDSTGDADLFPLRLQARAEDVVLDLRLTSAKEKVLQGDQGLSQKGPGMGNASRYYSFTRLPTEGTVAVEGTTHRAKGTSWMDREWSTSALGAGQEGWDWFALQLSDGRELMYYQLRKRGGAPSRFSEGVLLGPQGERTALKRADVTLGVQERWTSERGATYPSQWRLQVPSESLDLTVTPYFPNQVMNTSVRYWEGAVRVEGTTEGTPVDGSGYVELTGYEDGKGQKGEGIFP